MASSVPCRFESRLVAKFQRQGRERSQSMNISSTKSIPIRMNRQDMLEDWEIREQEMIADERDHFMFHRIVNGMIARRDASTPPSATSYHSETEKSIARILRTRYRKVELDTRQPNDDSDALANDCDTSHSPSPSYSMDDENRPPETIFVMDM
eukprot:CAMPEP_0202499166 /NCGR_PEP_ID=MMETSP1361-20130828/28848_1 /ASSEMBLY_ACC=CAM_ASM_000849 /TAXON_ID=210615 /ORGANISM="Staurosira complex sp., Strain CCMP2646" /LENGTH=152 /DNA_ID=CAMNT_0049131277 /DNA_START=120 /DNA_END=578 /DNA_ORIENTATION=+